MRYTQVRVSDNKGREVARHTDAIHIVDNGTHYVQAAAGTTNYYPLSYVINCAGPIKEEPITNSAEVNFVGVERNDDIDTDALIDAGNELYRLVVETRDSIHESNTLVGTDTFPDDEEGKAGKKWYKEYRNAARAWYNMLYQS